MKTYKNKKFYNFKKVHKRKKRTAKAAIPWKIGSKVYRKILNREYKAKCKVVLRRKLEGRRVEFPKFKKTLERYCS